MTIYDISEKAGVSIATVSRVLNGSERVSAATREKVLSIIEQSGYTPNAFARGLGLNTMKTIGVMCADSSDIYLAKAVYNIEQQLSFNGYDSLLCCSGYQLENKQNCMNLLLKKKVDGIILVGSNFAYETAKDNSYIKKAATQVPVMLLNADLDLPNVYCILSDDYEATYNATTELINSGLKDILYFFNSHSYSTRMKQAGYRDAMKKHGLWKQDFELYFDGTREDIPAMTDTLLKHYNEVTKFQGMLASEDVLGIAGIRFAQQKNLSIPDDLSIIGYNNSMLAHCCTPELSSIDNHPEQLCKKLIDVLLDVLAGKEVTKKAMFNGNMVHRGTTKH